MSTEFEAPTHEKLEVWIGCMACYNAGRLVGGWFDAAEADEITLTQVHAAVARRATPDCEEMWCYDLSAFPVWEEMSPSTAALWGKLYAQVDPSEMHALDAFVKLRDYEGDNVPDVETFREFYLGEWDSFRDFAENFAMETTMMDHWPDLAIQFFDWDAYAHDLEFSFDIMDSPHNTTFVFGKDC